MSYRELHSIISDVESSGGYFQLDTNGDLLVSFAIGAEGLALEVSEHRAELAQMLRVRKRWYALPCGACEGSGWAIGEEDSPCAECCGQGETWLRNQ